MYIALVSSLQRTGSTTRAVSTLHVSTANRAMKHLILTAHLSPWSSSGASLACLPNPSSQACGMGPGGGAPSLSGRCRRGTLGRWWPPCRARVPARRRRIAPRRRAPATAPPPATRCRRSAPPAPAAKSAHLSLPLFRALTLTSDFSGRAISPPAVTVACTASCCPAWWPLCGPRGSWCSGSAGGRVACCTSATAHQLGGGGVRRGRGHAEHAALRAEQQARAADAARCRL